MPVPDLAPIERLWSAHPLPDRRCDAQLLGELYQALSGEARRSRALCQTPPFVADLLWQLAGDDALTVFGPDLRMIDPACGTGHLLVETAIKPAARTGRSGRRIEQALAAVHGVDLDRTPPSSPGTGCSRWPAATAAAAGMPRRTCRSR